MTVRIGEAHRLWHRGIGVVNRELRWVAAIACAIISLAFVGWPRVSIADLPGVFPGTFTYHNDNLRTGQNLDETVLTPANVNAGSFGRLFSDPVDGQVYAEPLYVPGVSIPGQGTHNVVYVATENDTVYAFDGDAVGPPLWQTSLLPQGATAIPSSDTGCIIPQPEIGIPSTPVIDPVTQTIYVVAASKEGTNYVQRLHALDITTGLEQPGSPIVIQAQVTAPPGTISIVGGPQGNATLTGAFITVNSSTGVTSGDVIFAYVGTQSSTNITVTTPTGWTLLAGPLNPSTGINSYLFQRISDGTDGASYTFNFSGNVSAVSYAHLIAYRGVKNTTPLDGSVTTASQTSGTSLVLPAVSPVGPSDLLVAFVEDYGGFSGTVASTGMTNEASTGENAILDQQLASSGSTGTRTVTNLNSSVSTGFLFAVAPAAPTPLTAIVRTFSFDPLLNLQRSALLLDGGIVYIAFSSHCDIGSYHGWVLGYDAATLAQRYVFSDTPEGVEGGIWMSGGGIASDSSGDLYLSTGNGTFDANTAGGVDYGDTVLRLTPGASTLAVKD